MWWVGESHGESREGWGTENSVEPTSSKALLTQFFLAASWSSIACWMYIFPTKISFSSSDSSFNEMGQFSRSRALFKTALCSKYCMGLIASNLRNKERSPQNEKKIRVIRQKKVLFLSKTPENHLLTQTSDVRASCAFKPTSPASEAPVFFRD